VLDLSEMVCLFGLFTRQKFGVFDCSCGQLMRVPKSDRLAGMDFLEITRYQANGMFAVK